VTRPGSLRPARWRRAAPWFVLGLAAPVVALMCALSQYQQAAVVAAYAAVMARAYRRWPWLAVLLFRAELARTRHVGGQTMFTYLGPVQRRRRIPVEPAGPEVRRGS
jgi:hypothetical protein